MRKVIVHKYRELLGFVVVGLLNTTLTYLMYLFFLNYTQYSIAYTVSFIIGIIFSYFINTIFVFRVKINIKKLFQFPVVYIVQYLINLLLTFIYVNYLGIDANFALLLSLIITIPLTFIMSRFILKRK
ncbi:GtrA family protein [Paenibacillus thiaminolyticus]|uniref:GtrA family protein n=1 Tax=Paenibacillus thiaminolyticus TaxID=49283 RepID=UPI003B9858D3